MRFQRRNLIFAAAPFLAQQSQAETAAPDVSFVGDGIALPPKAYAALLSTLAEKPIALDNYSREGIVADLEARMAGLLGKESAVFLPTGTLANHLAVRLLANGGKVVVQHESHLYNDEGDCAQRLSGLNLVPLGQGKADFTLADVRNYRRAPPAAAWRRRLAPSR